MHSGNDRDTKLNKASVGADFVSEAELREKFANEAKLAAERAEARAAEISYARSYRNKLERTKSAAEIKRKREKEAVARAGAVLAHEGEAFCYLAERAVEHGEVETAQQTGAFGECAREEKYDDDQRRIAGPADGAFINGSKLFSHGSPH